METLRKPWTRGFIFPGIRMIALLSLLCGCIVQADEDADENRRKLSLYFEGEDIYQQSCLPCHGPRGKGDGPWAEGWTKNRPRNFRSGIFKFRTTPMGFLPTDEDLKRTITNGISGTAMPMFRGNLNEGNLEAVIVYLKSFSREWKKKERRAEPVALSEKPDWMDDSTQRKEHAELGKALFATYCAACHGAEGKGNDVQFFFWGSQKTTTDHAGVLHGSQDNRRSAHEIANRRRCEERTHSHDYQVL